MHSFLFCKVWIIFHIFVLLCKFMTFTCFFIQSIHHPFHTVFQFYFVYSNAGRISIIELTKRNKYIKHFLEFTSILSTFLFQIQILLMLKPKRSFIHVTNSHVQTDIELRNNKSLFPKIHCTSLVVPSLKTYSQAHIFHVQTCTCHHNHIFLTQSMSCKVLFYAWED